MNHYKKKKYLHSARNELSEFPSESAIFESATDEMPGFSIGRRPRRFVHKKSRPHGQRWVPRGLSMKRAISMDKEHFRGQLSTKSTDFMDKEHFKEQLSIKRSNFMDKEHFRGQLSMKRPDSMDKEEV